MFISILVYNLHTQGTDFVQALSKEEIKVDIVCGIPLGMRNPKIKGYNLRLLKFLYTLKDAGGP